MASRLYLASVTTAPVNPGFSAWGSTADAVRRKLLRTAPAAAEAMTTLTAACASTTGLLVQFVSDPMIAGIAMGGAFKTYALALEGAAAQDVSSRLVVKVYDVTGATLRTTFSLGSAGAPSEFDATTLTNRQWAQSVSVSNYTTQFSDRLVIEYAANGAAAGSASMRIGAAAASDLPEDETTTTDLRPWVEFAADITFIDEVAVDMIGTYEPTINMVGTYGA